MICYIYFRLLQRPNSLYQPLCEVVNFYYEAYFKIFFFATITRVISLKNLEAGAKV